MLRSFLRAQLRRLAPLAIGAALLAALPPAGAPASAAGGLPDNGIVCSTSPTSTFSITAEDGYIDLPDGNIIYMWSFRPAGGAFQYPGPVLCVNQGDTVTVVLNNTLPRPVSIVFPGQADVQANGAPSQPQTDVGGNLVSLAPEAPNGGSVTYSFVAGEPGTYLYESGSQAGFQVQMGLIGALIVRPAGFPSRAYADADTAFNPSKEYLLLLSEIDPDMHQAIERGATNYDMSAYRARYFLINGRSFPDTIAPNGASWLPSQPYGSLVHINPYSASNQLPALERFIGAGVADYPFHPHGNSARVIGRDGRALKGPAAEDLSFDKFSIPVGPGQTWDALFVWNDAENFNPTTNPIPVTVPQQQNLTYGQYYSGSPYLGGSGSLPIGSENYNVCGEYYHVAHNHALLQITSWGLTMSGQLTYTRIDPPLPNSCPQ